jgi:hypothetical protein
VAAQPQFGYDQDAAAQHQDTGEHVRGRAVERRAVLVEDGRGEGGET